MQGMIERQYASYCGLSKTGLRKAKSSGRLILHEDGSIDAIASDIRRASATDPSKSRMAVEEMKPVSNAEISAVGDP